MILSFSRKFPWGDPTNFIDKIQSGAKIHTFRIFKDVFTEKQFEEAKKTDRWKVGNKIHFWDHSPYVKGSKPFNLPELSSKYWATEIDGNTTIVPGSKMQDLNIVTPKEKILSSHDFGVPVVSAIEYFKMDFEAIGKNDFVIDLYIGSKYFSQINTKELQSNDGFNGFIDFRKYFKSAMIQQAKKKAKKSVSIYGRLIHWTEKVYDPSSALILNLDKNISV